MRYQNLFINSFNKNNGDTNYDYNLSIPEHDISCGENEEISLVFEENELKISKNSDN